MNSTMDNSANKTDPASNEQSDNDDDAEETEPPSKQNAAADYSSSSSSSSDSESDDDDVNEEFDPNAPMKELTLQDDDVPLLIQPPLALPEDDEGDDYGL